MHSTNAAGSTTSYFSRPVTVDDTPPECAPPPLLYPATDALTDRVVRPCAHGGACDRGPHGDLTWLGLDSTGVRAQFGAAACTDPESNISRIDVGVAYRGGAPEPSIVSWQTFVPPVWVALAWPASKRPLLAGNMHYVQPRCRNGAWASTFCEPLMFQVDGSPPTCFPPLVRLIGGGAIYWAQPESTQLRVGFQAAMYDDESGMLAVEYALQESADSVPRPGPLREPPLASANLTRLAGLDHKAPLPAEATAHDLRLTHGRWYRVLADATNGVGLTTGWCPSPWVLVDMTPPTDGAAIVVRDSSDSYLETPPDVQHQASTDLVYITLRGFEDDESGIYAFFVSLVRARDGCPLTLEQRFQHSSLIQFMVELRHGDSFQVRVRALNYANLVSDATSTTMTVDATPPVVGFVADFGIADEEVDLIRGPNAVWTILWEVLSSVACRWPSVQ